MRSKDWPLSQWPSIILRGGGGVKYGYLGVDIFFVVGGYLLVRQLNNQFSENKFNYCSFIFRKMVRLWPLVLIAAAVSIIIGYDRMLPDDYENLSQSVIASSAFANNILACITTKDYWDIVNLYKPLMHLWYIGVLMQSYVILPLIYLVFVKLFKDTQRGMFIGTVAITVVSLVLFLLPNFPTAQKFYYPQFRLFELTIGGLLCFATPKWKYKKPVGIAALVLLVLLLTAHREILPSSAMLLLTVAATFVMLACAMDEKYDNAIAGKIVGLSAQVGQRSYSIYIWHQVIVAFLFYSFFPKQNVASFLVFVLATAILSLLSYRLIEIPIGKTVGVKKKEAGVIIGSIVAAAVCCGASAWIYMHAGVVRDVPELNISVNNVHRRMHAEYCDRPYSWDVDFPDDGKVHILVLGDSFGRDWANILYEYDSKLDISYCFYTEEKLAERMDRVEKADFVFYAISGRHGVPDFVKQNVDADKLYVIGNKSYGESNGIIYAKRFSDDYYHSTVEVEAQLIQQNKDAAHIYGDHFINLMAPVMEDETHAHVFTDDHKYISQDCRHLTQAGAQFYARTIDLEGLLYGGREDRQSRH